MVSLCHCFTARNRMLDCIEHAHMLKKKILKAEVSMSYRFPAKGISQSRNPEPDYLLQWPCFIESLFIIPSVLRFSSFPSSNFLYLFIFIKLKLGRFAKIF